MAWRLNPFTGKFDYYSTSGGGITNASANTYLEQIGDTVYLYVNGEVRQTWTTTAVVQDIIGTPLPLGGMMHITYQ
jgi:hypothetical protein